MVSYWGGERGEFPLSNPPPVKLQLYKLKDFILLLFVD